MIMSNLIMTVTKDAKKTNDYQVKWSAGEMTDYIIKNNKDESAVIINGQIVSSEGMDIKVCLPDGGEDKDSLMIIQNVEADNSNFTVAPENEDNIDGTFYFEDYALSVNADAEAAEFGENGSIDLENAEGTVDIEFTLNHSKFDFVTIKGRADGNIQISLEEDFLLVKGELSDYKIKNIDRNGSTSEIFVDGKKEIKAYMEDGELTMTYKIKRDE